MNDNIEGWPLTDPYPYRDSKWPPSEKMVDCGFVTRDKEYAKTANIEEMGDYAYIMRPVWQLVNEQTQEIKELKDHIQWLKNVGGEHLNMACGVDIICRDMVIKKQREKEERAIARMEKKND